MRSRHLSALAIVALAVSTAVAQQAPPQGGRGGQRQGQPRDAQPPRGTSTLGGRVLAADTGRPVKRARVLVSGNVGGGRGGGAALTDEQGRYTVTGLAAGTYTVTASKSGFVDAVYGQRRPLQAGTPVQLADGQSAPGIDLRLTRGGVITGHVLDEDGEALPRALVTVQRYQYQRGERQLQPVGGDQTDDRGQFRVFGLPPGDYYVSASAAGLEQLLGRGLQQLAGAALGGRGGRGAVGAFVTPAEPEPAGYAPTYFPGVVNAPDAGRVPVGPGQEVSGIDFQIQLVPLATVTGIVVGADEGTNVMMTPQDAAGGPLARLGGQLLMGRVQTDGTFSIASVPPGRYVAIARSGGGRGGGTALRVGTQAVVVNGQNIEGHTLALQPGVTLPGHLTVESAGTPAPSDYSVFRIDVPEVNPLPFGGGGRGGGPLGGGGRSEKNGTFTVPNLLPGLHYIRVSGGGVQGAGQASWTVKSVTVGGQDVSDAPLEIKPGQNIDNVSVVLTDRTTDLSGTVRNAKNEGVSALTVIVFSAEPQYWRPQSRRINAARTDQSGTYRVRNLPPGDYLMVAVDDVEQGEWFDPAYLEKVRQDATRISISEGEKKTQDLKSPS
jgi:protocatechuate 3,4-dioxygenase beta subunit